MGTGGGWWRQKRSIDLCSRISCPTAVPEPSTRPTKSSPATPRAPSPSRCFLKSIPRMLRPRHAFTTKSESSRNSPSIPTSSPSIPWGSHRTIRGWPWGLPPTLWHRVSGETPAEIADVINVLKQVARGLEAMHNLKPPLIHQDLKPANVLIDSLGNFKITDFSLATVTSANRTHNLATVRYAAPEILSAEFGRVSPATDLYALGHIAYEMALGSRLHVRQFPAVFEGNTAKEPAPNKWMMWHASSHTKPPAIIEVRKDFPPGLSALIAKLMAKPLAERYATATDLLRDLERETSIPVAPSAPPPAAGRNAPPPPPPPAPPPPAATSSDAGASAPATAAPPPPALQSAPSGPATRYWVRLRGRVTGPYDFATLQRQVKQGALSRLHQGQHGPGGLEEPRRNWRGCTDQRWFDGMWGRGFPVRARRDKWTCDPKVADPVLASVMELAQAILVLANLVYPAMPSTRAKPLHTAGGSAEQSGSR